MLLDELVKKNEIRKDSAVKYGFNKLPNVVYRIEKYEDGLWLIDVVLKDRYKKLTLDAVSAILDNVPGVSYITNISLLKKYRSIWKTYNLSRMEWVGIKQVLIRCRTINNLRIFRVDNLEIHMAKEVLKKGFSLLENKLFYVIYKVNNDVHIVSELSLVANQKDGLTFTGLDIEHIYLDNIDVSELKSLRGVFASCGNTKTITIYNFDTRNVVDYSYMFSDCMNLEKVDITCFNTEKGVRFTHMFYNCIGLTFLDLNNFNMSNADYLQSMFENCIGLNKLVISKWKLKPTAECYGMFENCKGLDKILC